VGRRGRDVPAIIDPREIDIGERRRRDSAGDGGAARGLLSFGEHFAEGQVMVAEEGDAYGDEPDGGSNGNPLSHR
jgi:hypothetical protein